MTLSRVTKVKAYRRRSRRGRPYFVRSYLKNIERQAARMSKLNAGDPRKVAFDAKIDEAYVRGTVSYEEYSRLMTTLHGKPAVVRIGEHAAP